MFYQNQILSQRYRIIEEIGKGGGGTIYKAEDQSLRKLVVIKHLRIPGSVEEIRREVDTLKLFRHSNIPQVHDFFIIDGCGYTVMDFIEGIDLQRLSERKTVFSTENLIKWYKQIGSALEAMHSLKTPIYHCDIKPGNIIITPENDAVLIDYNIATTQDVRGCSPNFGSPEQIHLIQSKMKLFRTDEVLDGRTDIYSLGATFYYLMTGILPNAFFKTKPLLKIKNKKYPDAFCKIIDKSMQVDKEDRYKTVRDMNRDLDHMRQWEKEYQRYVLGQCAVILLSGTLTAAGLFMFFRGISNKQHQEFITEYNACVQTINIEDYNNGILSCLKLLNEQEKELKKYPDKKGTILLELAKGYDYNKDFSEALNYYNEAKKYLTNSDEQIECYSGAIDDCMKLGEQGSAEVLLVDASDKGVDSTAIQLLRIQMKAATGDMDSCIHDIETLRSSCSDIRILSRAYLTAGENSKPASEQFNWYREAAALNSQEAIVQRRIGYDFLNLASVAENQSQILDCCKYSEQCYRCLVKKADSSANDFINLSTALRMQSRYDEALECLLQLENSKILDYNHGLLWMHKAFIYGEKGDFPRTSEALRQTFSILDRTMVNEDEWMQLMNLKSKYNLS